MMAMDKMEKMYAIDTVDETGIRVATMAEFDSEFEDFDDDDDDSIVEVIGNEQQKRRIKITGKSARRALSNVEGFMSSNWNLTLQRSREGAKIVKKNMRAKIDNVEDKVREKKDKVREKMEHVSESVNGKLNIIML